MNLQLIIRPHSDCFDVWFYLRLFISFNLVWYCFLDIISVSVIEAVQTIPTAPLTDFHCGKLTKLFALIAKVLWSDCMHHEIQYFFGVLSPPADACVFVFCLVRLFVICWKWWQFPLCRIGSILSQNKSQWWLLQMKVDLFTVRRKRQLLIYYLVFLQNLCSEFCILFLIKVRSK